MPDLDPAVIGYLSELGKRGSASLHAGTTPEQRRARTAAATAARKSAAEKIAELEARFEGQIDSLRAEVADLRQRVAA